MRGVVGREEGIYKVFVIFFFIEFAFDHDNLSVYVSIFLRTY